MPAQFSARLLLGIRLGPGASGMFASGLPVLGGEGTEDLFHGARRTGSVGPVAIFEGEGWRLGVASSLCESGLEEATMRLYGAILGAARGWNLARIWNYVPAINAPGPAGLENYMIFCRARSLAFEETFGVGFKGALPSASAVGTASGALTVVFAASEALPIHYENPLQVPAYEYPDEYGPRAPSFARGTVVPGGAGATVFISGTAAIRGHKTVAPRLTPEQLDYSVENLSRISEACGLGGSLDRGGRSERHFKVYLRSPEDLDLVSATLRERLLSDGDHVSYLRADLCRTALQVEIEATLFGVAGLAQGGANAGA